MSNFTQFLLYPELLWDVDNLKRKKKIMYCGYKTSGNVKKGRKKILSEQRIEPTPPLIVDSKSDAYNQ